MFGDGAENRRVSAIFRLRDGGDLGYIVTCIKDNDGYSLIYKVTRPQDLFKLLK